MVDHPRLEIDLSLRDLAENKCAEFSQRKIFSKITRVTHGFFGYFAVLLNSLLNSEDIRLSASDVNRRMLAGTVECQIEFVTKSINGPGHLCATNVIVNDAIVILITRSDRKRTNSAETRCLTRGLNHVGISLI